MIGFVTWPPFFIPKCYKGGQVTNTCEQWWRKVMIFWGAYEHLLLITLVKKATSRFHKLLKQMKKVSYWWSFRKHTTA